MISVTKTGQGLTGLALLMYIASMQEMSGLLFLVLGIIVGCFIYNLICAIKHISALHIIPANIMTATEGEPLRGSWTFFNPTSHIRGFIELKSKWGPLFKVGAVLSGERIDQSPELSLNKRGVYPYKGLTMVCGFPFGLLRYQRYFNQQGKILIYPAVYHCDPPQAGGLSPCWEGKQKGNTGRVWGTSSMASVPCRRQIP